MQATRTMKKQVVPLGRRAYGAMDLEVVQRELGWMQIEGSGVEGR